MAREAPMKRASSEGDSGKKFKKPSVASEAPAFPRGAGPRAPKETGAAARRPDADALFKSPDAKAKQAGLVLLHSRLPPRRQRNQRRNDHLSR